MGLIQPNPTPNEAGYPQFDLGILFIHGIGQQTEGQTLHQAAEPLLDWLEENGVKVDLQKTHLKPGTNVSPAVEAILTLPKSKRISLLLTESCWANTFDPPSPFQFAGWLYGPGSAAVVRQLADWAIECVCQITFGHPPGRRHGFYVFLGALVGLAAFALVPFFQLIILLLAGLSAIPFLKIGALGAKCLRTLASILGDAQVFSSGRLDRDAIRSRVGKDLNVLRSLCHKTVIAAHSQGAAVAIETLRRALDLNRLSLITYGSGWRKLEDLRTKRTDSLKLLTPFLLPIAAILLWISATNPGTALLLGLLIWVLLIPNIGHAAVLRSFALEQVLSRCSYRLLKRKLQWVDLIATRDPVSAGALFHVRRRSTRSKCGRCVTWAGFSAPKTYLVVNQENPLSDHTAYWRSRDFIRTFVWAIKDCSRYRICPEESLRDPQWAFFYSRLRTCVRNLANITLYVLTAVLYWRAIKEMQTISLTVVPFVAGQLNSLVKGAEVLAPALTWVLGGMLLLAAAMVWTRFVSGSLWEIWDRSSQRGAFRQWGLMILYLASIAFPATILVRSARAGRIELAADLTNDAIQWLTKSFVSLILIAVVILIGLAAVVAFIKWAKKTWPRATPSATSLTGD